MILQCQGKGRSLSVLRRGATIGVKGQTLQDKGTQPQLPTGVKGRAVSVVPRVKGLSVVAVQDVKGQQVPVVSSVKAQSGAQAAPRMKGQPPLVAQGLKGKPTHVALEMKSTSPLPIRSQRKGTRNSPMDSDHKHTQTEYIRQEPTQQVSQIT